MLVILPRYFNLTVLVGYVLVSKVVRGDQALDEGSRAIDEGGPSREFIHQVWKQMPRLKVSYKASGASVALFTEGAIGLIPQTNDMVENAIEGMIKEAKNDKLSQDEKDRIPECIRNKMKAIYRAIGRIMARCMLSLDQRSPDDIDADIYHKFLISAKALPVFYRNGKSHQATRQFWLRFEPFATHAVVFESFVSWNHTTESRLWFRAAHSGRVQSP
jgi:hypothetical protein